MPGYEDIQAYPDHPDIEHARDLANWHPGDPLRPITVYYRSGSPVNETQAQIVRQNLIDIGFEPNMVGFSGGNIYTAIGTRGEPFDLAVSIGSCEDYHDPWDFISLYDGTTIHDGQGNTNYSYFNDPVFNDRMHAANELSGDPRYDAFQQIEHDLVLNAAPSAAVRTYNNRYFFSQRIGCQHLQGGAAYGIDFVQLCVRPAITTDDTTHSRAGYRNDDRSRDGEPEQRDGRPGLGGLRDRRTGPRTRERTTSRRPGHSRSRRTSVSRRST